MKKEKKKTPLNEWVNKASKNIATAFNDHNYVKQYEELKEQAELIEIEFLEPKFHSETRFANSSEKVFKTAYRDLPLIN